MKDSFILGVAVPGEALETMVKLCFWPSTVLVHELGKYCDISGTFYVQWIFMY